jgi:hypothetical protein
MTLKQAARLNSVQAGKLTPKSLALIMWYNRVDSPVFRKLVKDSKNKSLLHSAITHSISKAKEGDVRARLFLNRLTQEKFTKDNSFRRMVLGEFSDIAVKGDSFGLRWLLIGVRDSSIANRSWALWGLENLAKEGDARTLPGLLKGIKDSDADNRDLALSGLKELTKCGNSDARRVLVDLAKKRNFVAKQILAELDKQV